MILVVDTSVWISTLGAKNKAYMLDILELAGKGGVKMVSSKEVWLELEELLNRIKMQNWLITKKLGYKEYVKAIQGLTDFIDINPTMSYLDTNNYKLLEERDVKDIKFLKLSEQSKADILITQDKDLLDLITHGKTKITKPREALFLIKP
jgi:putative PIN family toxin of toxin-antitoxin system